MEKGELSEEFIAKQTKKKNYSMFIPNKIRPHYIVYGMSVPQGYLIFDSPLITG